MRMLLIKLAPFDDWIYRVMDKAIYLVEWQVALVLWSINQALLFLVYLIDRLRGQLTTFGFAPLLRQLETTISPYLVPLLALGLTLWLLQLIAQPIIELRLVNVRKLALLVMLGPLLLTSLPTWFTEIEQARVDFGDTLYREVLPAVSFSNLVPSSPTGTSPEVRLVDGQIPKFDPASPTADLHGVDVAAAYLFAQASDVLQPTTAISVPVEFQTRFFFTVIVDLPVKDAPERQAAIQQGGLGVARQGWGILLALFALCETLTHALFAFGLGVLFIGLMLCLALAWFSPVEGLATQLSQQVISLLIASWSVSLLSAVIMALLLSVTGSGSAAAILGLGVVALILQVVLLINGAKAAFAALAGAAAALSGGSVSPERAAATLGTVGGHTAAVAGAAVTGGVGAVGGLHAGAGYLTARRAGASRQYALGYAASTSRRLTRLGELAAAMGPLSLERDLGRGLYVGSVPGRGAALGLRDQQAVRGDVARGVEQRAQEQQALGTLVVLRQIRGRQRQHERAREQRWARQVASRRRRSNQLRRTPPGGRRP